MAFSIPLSITNTAFFYWIFTALQNVLNKLKDDHQIVKYGIMRNFTVILVVTYLIAFAGLVAEIMFKFSGERDFAWRYEWVLETLWFTVFSCFLFAVMLLMRPNERSKMLAMMT